MKIQEILAIGTEVGEMEVTMTMTRWALNVTKFLTLGKSLGKVQKANNIRRRATHFTMINRTMYKQDFSAPFFGASR